MSRTDLENRVLVCFLLHDYPILDKLFQLCSFMQTVIPHENHFDGFFLTHTQSPEIINFDIIFALFLHPFSSHWKDYITESHIRNASNNILHSAETKKGPNTFQTRLLVSQKVIKCTKRGAILIIISYRGQYAIPKINMLRNLMLFENEVKAAVHLISTVQQPEPRFTTA